MNKQSWSIIIFCYDEEGSVDQVLEETKLLLKKIASEWEIIVINDGSTDDSLKKITPFLGDSNITLISHDQNQGIGPAIIAGYTRAMHENVCAIPADGEFDVQELLPFSKLAPNTILSFYRQVKPSYRSYRDALSYFNRKLNQVFIGLKMRDVNWVKVYKRESLTALRIELRSSLIESEICAKLIKSGTSLIEVPSTYHIRKKGKSKGSSFKIVWQAVRETFRLVWTCRNT